MRRGVAVALGVGAFTAGAGIDLQEAYFLLVSAGVAGWGAVFGVTGSFLAPQVQSLAALPHLPPHLQPPVFLSPAVLSLVDMVVVLFSSWVWGLGLREKAR